MDISAIALEGMTAALGRVQTAAVRIAQASTNPEDPVDLVDLSAEMVALMDARNNFAANVNVARTADDIERATLSLLG